MSHSNDTLRGLGAFQVSLSNTLRGFGAFQASLSNTLRGFGPSLGNAFLNLQATPSERVELFKRHPTRTWGPDDCDGEVSFPFKRHPPKGIALTFQCGQVDAKIHTHCAAGFFPLQPTLPRGMPSSTNPSEGSAARFWRPPGRKGVGGR